MTNLAEQISKKTEKQIISMMRARNEKSKVAYDFNYKYDTFPYNEVKKYQTKIAKNEKIMNEIHEWYKAALSLFDEEKWEDLVCAAGMSIDCYAYDEMT